MRSWELKGELDVEPEIEGVLGADPGIKGIFGEIWKSRASLWGNTGGQLWDLVIDGDDVPICKPLILIVWRHGLGELSVVRTTINAPRS